MYANANDYILWLFKQWWVYLIFFLGQYNFESDTFYVINQWKQVTLAIRKSYENWRTKYFNQFENYSKREIKAK